ncbi:hypothetical protein BGZ96_006586 [Linnemannia gamsii]|uniref:non-specific serine/threonine protein kinase n=1 Tax=Linnemannia gamsii TaxID=64522 RepID=A0ABQ7KFD1_9FUNG|nr:hypothetical protein BGZ96_006586 [Linnemannia gamsii]
MSVFAAPGASIEWMEKSFSTCAGPSGAWTVGVNSANGNLTFVHSTRGVILTKRSITVDFIGGNCFESGNTVYYISDQATGNLTGGMDQPRLAVVKLSLNGRQTLSPVDVDANMKLVPVFNDSGDSGAALVSLPTQPATPVQVKYYSPDLTFHTPAAPYQIPPGVSFQEDLFILEPNAIHFVTKEGPLAPPFPNGKSDLPAPTTPIESLPPTQDPQPKASAANHLPAIIGGVVGALVLVAIAAFLVIRRRKTRRSGSGNMTTRSLFSKKQQDLFPPKADDTLLPLGLYNQDRSLPPPPHQDDDSERRGYISHQGMRSADAPERTAFLSHHQHRSGTQPSIDETIPVEAALAHHRHDTHTPQGLHHSISVSSVTSRFPRHSAKSGKLFEEKIQLQVIRYEVPDAHLMAPHGTLGRLVLGTYHIISDPKSARSLKPQNKNNQGLARSGTVVVRKSRASMLSGRNSPLVEMAEESSMLLNDAENQHTFEGATLKWYMTEIHWKREAALLKRLKSPIFVMELLESYCIPALQNRAFTYPFVNAMGGRTSLLSDLSPVKTAQHTRAILRSISAAVEWCHRHGVVHLNIQPGSFFLEDDIDPRTEDASWKLWDFTCARYIGERIGPFGGSGETATPSQYEPPANPSSPDSFPYMDQQQHDRQMDRIGGNPLPAAYTAPELLEAWRADDINFPIEANMDTWSLGCLYYEILTGYPLFPSETEAWGLVGGWDQTGLWSSKNFSAPYPPSPSAGGNAPPTNESETNSPYERSQILDPSGSIAKLLRDMMATQPEERVSLETIMERIY